MADLLLQPVAWLVFGPVESLLSASPLLAVPTVGALCLAAVWAGAQLGAACDHLAASFGHLTAAARRAVTAAALLVAVTAPPRVVPAPHTHRLNKTPGGNHV